MPFEISEFLLLLQQLHPHRLVHIRLVRLLNRARQLPVNKLIPQSQRHIRQLLLWIRNRPFLHRRFRHQHPHLRRRALIQERAQVVPSFRLMQLDAFQKNRVDERMLNPARIHVH